HPRQPVGSFLNFPLSYLGGLLIAHVHLMHSVSPIPSHVVSLHFPFLLLRFVLPIPIALNGMFALYRSSIRGHLSIEPLAPFSHRPGQSLPDPPGDRIKVVLMPASSLNRCHIKMFSSMTMCNQGNIRISWNRLTREHRKDVFARDLLEAFLFEKDADLFQFQVRMIE